VLSQEPQECGQQEVNVEYAGNDISNKAAANVNECCAYCAGIADCTHYTFKGGKCFAKNSDAGRKESQGSTSAPVNPGRCVAIEMGVDYEGNDIDTVAAANQGECCEFCTLVPGCRVWSLSGGICHAKSSGQGRKDKAGFVSGAIDPYLNEDFAYKFQCETVKDAAYTAPNVDLESAPVENAEECCNFCGHTDGCEAWTYENGQCKTKSSAAGRTTRKGAVSGSVTGIRATDSIGTTFNEPSSQQVQQQQQQQQDGTMSTPVVVVYCVVIVTALVVVIGALVILRKVRNH